MKITNNSDIPLALAVWLLADDYDYINDPDYISVTRLMKPLRHILLPSLVPAEERTLDIADLIPSALGRSIHDSIEKAWVTHHKKALALLGYPQDVIDCVLINPDSDELSKAKNAIPVYLELREIKEFEGKKIGGKFDITIEGVLHDNKSTSAYTWVHGSNDKDYQLQGSLYRWLNPERVTSDFIRINFIFTDWQKSQAAQNPKYPQSRLAYKDIPLLTIKETEQWIRNKLNQLKQYYGRPESQIPECTTEELWMADPVYKYYADPTKVGGRSTKNFTNAAEAGAFKASKGNRGVIVTVQAEPKRCGYCDAFSVCTQKDKYFIEEV